MKINLYAEDAIEAMNTPDRPDERRNVFVVHYPEHVRQTMPDHCPGETTDEVFEELQWDLLMNELRGFAS